VVEGKGSGTFSQPDSTPVPRPNVAPDSRGSSALDREKEPDPGGTVAEGKGSGTFSHPDSTPGPRPNVAPDSRGSYALDREKEPDPSLLPWLVEGPIRRPFPWLEFANRAESEAELLLLRESANRGTPFGDADWQKETGAALGQESTMRPRGRPRKT